MTDRDLIPIRRALVSVYDKAGLLELAAVLAEQGCIEYQATVDAKGLPPSKGSVGDDTFVVIEKWESLAALQAHGAAPHMQAYGAKVKDLLASRVFEGASQSASAETDADASV